MILQYNGNMEMSSILIQCFSLLNLSVFVSSKEENQKLFKDQKNPCVEHNLDKINVYINVNFHCSELISDIQT